MSLKKFSTQNHSKIFWAQLAWFYNYFPDETLSLINVIKFLLILVSVNKIPSKSRLQTNDSSSSWLFLMVVAMQCSVCWTMTKTSSVLIMLGCILLLALLNVKLQLIFS